jgi:hypothetical protein
MRRAMRNLDFYTVEGREYMRTIAAEDAEVAYTHRNVLNEAESNRLALDFWKHSAWLLMRLLWLGVIAGAVYELVRW